MPYYQPLPFTDLLCRTLVVFVIVLVPPHRVDKGTPMPKGGLRVWHSLPKFSLSQTGSFVAIGTQNLVVVS